MFEGMREVPLENDDPSRERLPVDPKQSERFVDADEAAERLLRNAKHEGEPEPVNPFTRPEYHSPDDIANFVSQKNINGNRNSRS